MILACHLFIKEKGAELLKKNLFRNYIVHLNSLFNYGFINPRQIDENIQELIVSLNWHLLFIGTLNIDIQIVSREIFTFLGII